MPGSFLPGSPTGVGVPMTYATRSKAMRVAAHMRKLGVTVTVTGRVIQYTHNAATAHARLMAELLS